MAKARVARFLGSENPLTRGTVSMVQSQLSWDGLNKSQPFSPIRYAKVSCLTGAWEAAAGLSALVNTGSLAPIAFIRHRSRQRAPQAKRHKRWTIHFADRL